VSEVRNPVINQSFLFLGKTSGGVMLKKALRYGVNHLVEVNTFTEKLSGNTQHFATL
jgi:hypothetical protein